MHAERYSPLDAGGSLIAPGRFNTGRGDDGATGFAALYLALAPEVALAEMVRHADTEGLDTLIDRQLSELACSFAAVIDCRNPTALGLKAGALLDDHDYSVSHALAAAAFAAGAEGILVPSATALGDNLVVFPANLRPESRLVVVSSRSPRLRRLDR